MKNAKKLNFYKRFSSQSTVIQEEITLDSGIKISISETEIKIKVPFASLDSIFYKIGSNIFEISTDLRRLYTATEKLHSAGIASLLLFGAVVPPLSPFETIHTFIPGFKYEINLKTFEMKSDIDCQWSKPEENDFSINLEEQAAILSRNIDDALKNASPDMNPIVLFSGGVDASAMAMRVVDMGWTNASYVHYSFGKDDRETSISKEIAKVLGITVDIVQGDLGTGFRCLEQAANIYPQPFCNHGSVQSYDLAHAIISKYGKNRTIIDGSGADGIFGLFGDIKKSKYLYKIPRGIRTSVGSLYRHLDLWKNTSKFEYYIRVLRRSAAFSSVPNFISYNPLFNISYNVSTDDLSRTGKLCEDWMQSVSHSKDDMEMIPLLDTVLFNIQRSVPKLAPIFESNDFKISYPFMKHKFIDLALNHTRYWPGSTYPKKALKYLLATKVHSKLVYRQKQGFLGPLLDKFAHPLFISHLDQVANTNSPLYDITNQKILKKMRDLAASRKSLALQTYNFLWALTFTNSWLLQLKENTINAQE